MVEKVVIEFQDVLRVPSKETTRRALRGSKALIFKPMAHHGERLEELGLALED